MAWQIKTRPAATPVVVAMRQLDAGEVAERNRLLNAADTWRLRLSADAYHSLRCAIFNSCVIDFYTPACADEPVLELNHFPGTEGFCCHVERDPRMTAWAWESWHMGVLEGEYLAPLERLG